MLKFTVKNLINACQNPIKHIVINRITSDMCAYDPEEEMENIFVGDYMAEIDAGTLESEVQDFEIYDNSIRIYI